MEVSKEFWIFYVFLSLFQHVCIADNSRCNRIYSRMVREYVNEKIMPVYSMLKLKMPSTCQLELNKELYYFQEEKSIAESAGKFKCDICGKLFIAQPYLDFHFDNRHKDYINKNENATCLADFCDIVRCDVVTGKKIPDFWDISLCLEEDMQDLRQECHKILDSCIPKELTYKEQKNVFEHLDMSLCHFLTCKNYWEGPPVKSTDGVVMFSVLTVFMIIFMIIYYCVAYHYFYTDTFSDNLDYEYASNSATARSTKVSSIKKSEVKQRHFQDKRNKIREFTDDIIDLSTQPT